MLDHHNGITGVYQLLQYVNQTMHVGNVQASGRLIQNIDGLSGRTLRKLCGKLYSLGLSSGKRSGGLSDLHISQAYILKRLKLTGNLWKRGKELQPLVYRHFQNIIDVFILVFDLQGFPVIPFPFAHLTGNINIRQKVHLDF